MQHPELPALRLPVVALFHSPPLVGSVSTNVLDSVGDAFTAYLFIRILYFFVTDLNFVIIIAFNYYLNMIKHHIWESNVKHNNNNRKSEL